MSPPVDHLTTPHHATPPSVLELIVADGRRIAVAPGLDADADADADADGDTLRRLLAVLERTPCSAGRRRPRVSRHRPARPAGQGMGMVRTSTVVRRSRRPGQPIRPARFTPNRSGGRGMTGADAVAGRSDAAGMKVGQAFQPSRKPKNRHQGRNDCHNWGEHCHSAVKDCHWAAPLQCALPARRVQVPGAGSPGGPSWRGS